MPELLLRQFHTSGWFQGSAACTGFRGPLGHSRNASGLGDVAQHFQKHIRVFILGGAGEIFGDKLFVVG
jgi:hypothetical protein